jgi:hypothetical protein
MVMVCTKPVLLEGRAWDNPAIVIYNATSSLACFENKIILIYFEKRSSLLHM